MPRKAFNTTEIFGRLRGLASQQHSVNAHKSSVRSGWVGRGGRAPSFMANTTLELNMSKNG